MRNEKGQFVKGHAGYWLGKPLSEPFKQKLSEAFKHRVGDKNPAWKGGRIKSGGYISIWKPTHPYADTKGYVKEHRLIMEYKLGRLLSPEESVHHIDHDKYNNDPENLELVTWTEHALKHKVWLQRENVKNKL